MPFPPRRRRFLFSVLWAALSVGCGRGSPGGDDVPAHGRGLTEIGDAGTGTGEEPAGDAGNDDGGGSVADAGDGDAVDAGALAGLDLDSDGLADALEDQLARDYLPWLSNAPDDGCLLSGMVFRARPHPDDPGLIAVVYSRIYERDCGLGGHVGDNEAFGVTLDPGAPPPSGIVAIKAISHQDTVCQRVTECGSCAGLQACDNIDVEGTPWPVLYASKGKHGSVVDLQRGCSLFGSCLDTCELSQTPVMVPLVNVGEPAHPLVRDLTEQGFITAVQGWTEASVYHYDPWGEAEVGTAGVVKDDLVDDAFVTAACRAR